MSKTIDVVLGGTVYSIPMLNIGQLERMSELVTAGGPKGPFAILKIGMERADPPVLKADSLEATLTEVGEAVNKLMVLSGFKVDGPNVGAPEAAPGLDAS